MRKSLASKDVLVDETTCAARRGVSYSTQVRHRQSWQRATGKQVGIGPRPVITPNGKPRYWLSEIDAEQGSECA